MKNTSAETSTPGPGSRALQITLALLLAAACMLGYKALGINAGKESANEIRAIMPALASATRHTETLISILDTWKKSGKPTPESEAALSAFRPAAEAELEKILAIKCRTGACERARRIAAGELRNAISLNIIMQGCYYMSSSRLFANGINGECASYAGPEALGDIRAGREKLNAILDNPEKYTSLPAPAPLQVFSANAAPRRPNVIVILIDTLRADRTGQQGAHMPFLDSIAALGTRYADTRSQAPVTHLSVASMLTSRFPYTSGLSADNDIWNNHLSLAESFRAAGYDTAAFSANYLIAPETGFSFGFNTFVSRHWTNASALNQSVFSWFENNETKGNNFFLYIHTVDPHSPYLPPDKMKQILEKQNEPRWANTVSPNTLFNEYISKGKPVPAAIAQYAIPRLIENYDSAVKYSDSQLEDLISYLSIRGMLKNTIIAVTADHGETFLEHGDVEHTRDLYDELIRVPLILYGGAFSPGERRPYPAAENKQPAPVDTRVSLIDLMPTLLDAADIDIPPGCQGRSLLRNIVPQPSYAMTTMGFDTETAANNQTIYSATFAGHKLIRNNTLGTRRFYNLMEDPGEQKNIYTPGNAFAAALDAKITAWANATKERGALERSAHPGAEGSGSITNRDALKRTKKSSGGKTTAPKNREMLNRLKSLGYVK